jgi:excisionase family DNA binding protein
MNGFISIDELAEMLRVPKGWIYERTRCPRPDSLPFFKVGKYLRFRMDEIEAWLQQQRRGWKDE